MTWSRCAFRCLIALLYWFLYVTKCHFRTLKLKTVYFDVQALSLVQLKSLHMHLYGIKIGVHLKKYGGKANFFYSYVLIS